MRSVAARIQVVFDLDSTKPAGSVKIRVETIAHYLQNYRADIIAKKTAAAPAGCPLLDR